jgi:D-glycero-alpha-D-manno-heptose-7-phosphate kinase
LNHNFKNNFAITKTPLRISFCGGGTDMPYFFEKYYGKTISTTINKFIYVTVKIHSNFDEKYRLNYYETEIVNKINNIRNLRIKETLKYFKIKVPLYINTFADLPANSGLGSSSSFLVGLIKAIFALKGFNVSEKTIAELAFKIENKITRGTTGKQDHYISAYGGFNEIVYKKNITKVIPIKLNKHNRKALNKNLLFIWTEISRSSNANLVSQKNNYKNNKINLINLNKFTNNFIKEIKKKKINLKIIGNLLNKTWNLKKNLSKKISNRKLDKIYNYIIKSGAFGGKLLGAGGGGFFMFLCPNKVRLKIIKKFNIVNIQLSSEKSTICINE